MGSGVPFGRNRPVQKSAWKLARPCSWALAQRREQRRAIARQDRDALGLLAFKRANRSSRERAVIVDPAGEQILHRLGRTAIGDVRDVDADGGVDAHAVEMRAGARAARTELHLGVVRLGVGHELLHVIGGEVVPRHQHQGLVADETDRNEVGLSVVERLLVQRLIHRHHIDAAVQDLIAVGGRVRHARGSRHAAAAADVFDQDRLAEHFGHSRADDARDQVERTADAERHHDGHGPRREVLGRSGGSQNHRRE